MKQSIVILLIVFGMIPGSLAQKLPSHPEQLVIDMLEKPIHIEFYISRYQPEQFKACADNVKRILKSYKAYSKGQISYDIFDPDSVSQERYEYYSNLLTPVKIENESRNFTSTRLVYAGMIMRSGSKQEIISLFDHKIAYHYTIASKLYRFAAPESIDIAYLSSHDTPELDDITQSNLQTGIYQYNFYEITQLPSDLSQFEALLIISPGTEFTNKEIAKIRSYHKKGGHVFIALDQSGYNFYTNKTFTRDLNLKQWFSDFNININKNFVIDAQCSIVNVKQGSFNMAMRFPYAIRVNSYMPHPVTIDLPEIVFSFPSSITTLQQHDYHIHSLIRSSAKSNTIDIPEKIEVKSLKDYPFTNQNIPIGVAMEHKKSNNNAGRMILISDSEFLLDEYGNFTRKTEHLKLLTNALEWLTDPIGLSEIKIPE